MQKTDTRQKMQSLTWMKLLDQGFCKVIKKTRSDPQVGRVGRLGFFVFVFVVFLFFVDPEMVRIGRETSFPVLGGRFQARGGGAGGPPNLIKIRVFIGIQSSATGRSGGRMLSRMERRICGAIAR